MDLIVSCIDFNVCFGEGYISIVFLLQSLTGMYIFITIRQNVAEIVTLHGTDCKSETITVELLKLHQSQALSRIT